MVDKAAINVPEKSTDEQASKKHEGEKKDSSVPTRSKIVHRRKSSATKRDQKSVKRTNAAGKNAADQPLQMRRVRAGRAPPGTSSQSLSASAAGPRKKANPEKEAGSNARSKSRKKQPNASRGRRRTHGQQCQVAGPGIESLYPPGRFAH